jgi:hypothetical protein
MPLTEFRTVPKVAMIGSSAGRPGPFPLVTVVVACAEHLDRRAGSITATRLV